MIEVIVRAGIVGMPNAPDGSERRYPIDTSDIVKLLQEQGVAVTYEHEKDARELATFNALEVWLPVLDFSMNVLANIPANIMATTIMNFFQRDKSKVDTSILHVKYMKKNRRGEVVEFEGNGLGADVLKAMEKFERDARS